MLIGGDLSRESALAHLSGASYEYDTSVRERLKDQRSRGPRE
jgi:hypothetical protein